MAYAWELIEDDQAGYLWRIRVPGGWLYKHVNDLPIRRDDGELMYGLAWTSSLAFVPETLSQRDLRSKGRGLCSNCITTGECSQNRECALEESDDEV